LSAHNDTFADRLKETILDVMVIKNCKSVNSGQNVRKSVSSQHPYTCQEELTRLIKMSKEYETNGYEKLTHSEISLILISFVCLLTF
jgi:hypothetical protein